MGASVVIEVEVVLYDAMRPYPVEISQAEKQLVVFKGNHYYYSSYATTKQTTTVSLASDRVEAYSQLKPTSKSDSTITYGPYDNIQSYQAVSTYFRINRIFFSFFGCVFH